LIFHHSQVQVHPHSLISPESTWFPACPVDPLSPLGLGWGQGAQLLP
jgi:hypothetical protein